jgi:hypothetical protein
MRDAPITIPFTDATAIEGGLFSTLWGERNVSTHPTSALYQWVIV